MNDKALENEETWDLANAQPQPPIKNRRSVVSVAFRPEQLAEVARRARAAGMKLSEYIRSCSLADPSESIKATSIMITAGLGVNAIFRAESFAPVTSSDSPQAEVEEEPKGNAEIVESPRREQVA